MMEEPNVELVLHFLREGNFREAIELYHEETGVSRDKSRQAVADLAHHHGLGAAPRWLPFGLLGHSGLF